MFVLSKELSTGKSRRESRSVEAQQLQLSPNILSCQAALASFGQASRLHALCLLLVPLSLLDLYLSVLSTKCCCCCSVLEIRVYSRFSQIPEHWTPE